MVYCRLNSGQQTAYRDNEPPQGSLGHYKRISLLLQSFDLPHFTERPMSRSITEIQEKKCTQVAEGGYMVILLWFIFSVNPQLEHS
jgi:hypothetical protein